MNKQTFSTRVASTKPNLAAALAARAWHPSAVVVVRTEADRTAGDRPVSVWTQALARFEGVMHGIEQRFIRRQRRLEAAKVAS